MAKRLGKKARKFARKNLQSVQKRQRKLNSFFKRKTTSSRKGPNVDGAEEHETKNLGQQTIGGVPEDNLYGAISGNNLESLFIDDGNDLDEDVLDSDVCFAKPTC